MAAPREFTLGGVPYREIVKSTLRHDLWLMNRIRESGINEVLMIEGEGPDDFARRLLEQMIESGKLIPVLSGSIIEADREDLSWKVEDSTRIAQVLENLTDEADKQRIYTLTVQLILGFFSAGIVRSKVSQSFSRSTNPNRGGAEDSGSTEEPSTSGNGTN